MKYLKIVSVIAMLMVLLVACGGSSNRDELAAAGTPAVLYSSAPSALTVIASAPASPFTIGGGTPPYSASSSNASVATATVSGSSLNIAGGLVGNATVLILDSKGGRVEIALTVSAPQAAPALRTTAPSDIALAVGATNSFSIFGGTPPYLTSSSNASVVTSGVSGNSISVIGVGRGTANILALDSTGAQVSIAVTVGSTNITPLFTSASSAVTLTAGAPEVIYTVGGGVPPYSASSNNLGVATVAVTGTSLSMKGFSSGSATAVVLDSSGTKIDIALTVDSGTPATALRTTAPSAITLGVGSTDAFAISGGTPPYIASTSNSAVAKASVAGGTLSIVGSANGTANILALDSTGAQVSIAVTVGSTNITPLFTSASSAVTLTAGAPEVIYTIGGGVPPYSASSNNLGVATATVNGTSLSLTGLSSGSATAVVLDSAGTKIDIALTVGSGTPATALRTTAPSAITLGVGSTDAFAISGGTPPYIASTSNSAVAKASVTGGTLSIVGSANGTANILALDSTGAQVSIAVTVGSTNITPLFTSASSAVTLTAGAPEVIYTIGGGVPPYSASSNNLGVATATVNGTSLSLTGLSSGSATAVVLDSTGTKVEITLTVNSGTAVTALRTTAPSAITMGVGSSTTFTISGGVPPYISSPSNTGVATTSVTGTTLSITGVATGVAQVLALDSTGTQVVIAVTVGSTSATPLFTTAGTAVALAVGVGESTYTVGGGSPPYAVGSSNISVASASLTGSNLYLKGLSAGTSTIILLDSTGAKIEISATVSSNTPPTGTFFTTAPSSITLALAQVRTFAISGGLPPYATSSSNATVVNANVSGTTLTVTSGVTGNATIVVFDSTGAQIPITVTVGSAATVPSLYTTSPSAVTMGVGGTSTYTVDGGTPPYRVSSSNANVATAGINGSTLTVISGAAAGTAQILVFDSTGTQVVIALTVGSATAPELYTSAPSAISLTSAGAAAVYQVGGGVPPYATSSGNASVATSTLTGVNLTISPLTAGSGTIVVLDSTGTKVEIAVTVVGFSTPVTPLRTTAPAAITLAVLEDGKFTIAGGTQPYAVSSSNTAVAKVTCPLALAGGCSPELTISGVAAGSAQILVIDSTGTQVTIAVTVGAPTVTALSTTAPAAVTIASGAVLPASYTIFGGTPPYLAVSSNTAVLKAEISGGNKLDLTGITVGSANVEVIDATAQRSSTVAVTVSALAGAPLSVTPSGATGNVGDAVTFKVLGGASPYAVSVSNPSIATVSPATVAVTGDNFTATLLNVGDNIITVRDAQGQTTSLALTVVSTSPTVRLSPSAFTVGENNLNPIELYIYGGTPPYRALTTDLTKSSVPTGNITATTANPPTGVLSTTVGSSNTRCINPVTDAVPPVYIPTGTFDVTFTVFDSLGASASSVMTIKDNGAGLNLGCAPTATSIAITSATGIVGGNLTTGNVVSITVNMSSATTVTGTPQLALNIGGVTVQANYSSGTGTNSLVFTYTILAGQVDPNGISIDANSLRLNGGTLVDAAGIDAGLSHKAVTDNINFRVNTP